MAKRIRRDQAIYIAPEIIGFYDNNQAVALDERNETELDPNDLNDKIIIYERQVNDWFLNRATRFLRGDKNGFIILMICLSYLEGVEQYRRGQNSNGQSRVFFRNAVNRIYPNTYAAGDLDDLYTEARCGLFHNGMVRGKIIISERFQNPISFPDQDTIQINPRALLNDIKADFREYLANLKDPQNAQLRNNFNAMFSNI